MGSVLVTCDVCLYELYVVVCFVLCGCRSQMVLKWIDRQLWTADTTGSLVCWSLERAEAKCRLQGHTDLIMNICHCPNLGFIATCSLDLTVRLWDVAREECAMVYTGGHEKAVFCIAYSDRQSILCSGGLDSYVCLWTPSMKEALQKLPIKDNNTVIGLEIPGGSNELIVGDNDGVFTIFDLRSFQKLQVTSYFIIISRSVFLSFSLSLSRFQDVLFY